MNQQEKEERIIEIIDQLEANLKDVKSCGLQTGVAGIALFFLSSYKAKLISQKQVQKVLDHFLEKVRNDELPYSLADGLVGIGFVIQEFIKEGFLDEDYQNFLDYLDDVINPITLTMFKKAKYDYFHCGLGAIDFMLTRPNEKNVMTIKQSIELLTSFAEHDDFGTFWYGTVDKVKGVHELQRPLGAAHGQTSIIHLMTKLFEAGYLSDKELIHSAVRWVMAQQNFDFSQNSIFPARLIDDDFSTLGSRLGWCTGDLGILFPIYFTSKKLKFKEFEHRSLTMLLHTTTMRDLEKHVVMDNGFCHGVAGIAHMYGRLYRETQLEEFNDAYTYWIRLLMERRKNLEDNLPDPFDMNGGVAGIGLTLLANLGHDSSWDRFFILS